MFLIVVCIQLVVQVLSEAPPAPPQNVHVDGWLMTWTPAAEDRDVTYTVQYRIASIKWTDVPTCLRISANRCDVHVIKDKSMFGCVMLRVRAERRGLNSVRVEACSTHGDSCIPQVSLTARPGYLTVHLSRNHPLAREYGDHARHRVHYGREGEPLENFKDGVSSLSIEGLQEGQRYCVKVQFLNFSNPTGLPRCPQCELIPNSTGHSGQAEIIVPVVLVLVLVVLTPAIAYVLLFHCGRFKRWLRRTRCEIPDHFLVVTRNHEVPSCQPEEHTEVISSVTLA
uniref:uncharacterized protein LOC124066979 isoform X2 n=1 Tax=Scatophagus argus TaxID=75038 RepID=UPI001ED7E883|nr:uncharacterized protein LOC124066979 isoform X2 [Scatophagus argus]